MTPAQRAAARELVPEPLYLALMDAPNWRCSLALHWLTKRLRAEGYVGYFDLIRRYRCLCGAWEYVEMNGHHVKRERGR